MYNKHYFSKSFLFVIDNLVKKINISNNINIKDNKHIRYNINILDII